MNSNSNSRKWRIVLSHRNNRMCLNLLNCRRDYPNCLSVSLNKLRKLLVMTFRGCTYIARRHQLSMICSLIMYISEWRTTLVIRNTMNGMILFCVCHWLSGSIWIMVIREYIDYSGRYLSSWIKGDISYWNHRSGRVIRRRSILVRSSKRTIILYNSSHKTSQGHW